MSDPVQTLEQIIEAWWDLEVETLMEANSLAFLAQAFGSSCFGSSVR